MIQLVSKEGKIIYKLPTSEMFPNYRSVLVEAIAIGVDLSKLHVVGEDINNVNWERASFNELSFENCKMVNNAFKNCTATLRFESCDISRCKIKNSIISDLNATNCEAANVVIQKTKIDYGQIDRCNLANLRIENSHLIRVSFYVPFIKEAIFRNSLFDHVAIYEGKKERWCQDVSLIDLVFNECRLDGLKDLSQLYLWNIKNTEEMWFENMDYRYSIILNANSTILYSLDFDVVWWNYREYGYAEPKQVRPLRMTSNEFIAEVKNDYPTTEIYPQCTDDDLDDELVAAVAYIKTIKEITGYFKE
ncbi:pentapeptide repeat-containing protein [Tamlana fucoidanivorans]|uniref:Pentapeptide repeat-containing protein n=1 Tax=Allotamlana fucoidanivorans TaxID=2583814 RepID=A0A5C4SCR1_9FLAO|nr:pentapeptide repeat-containing protein [Tamlana fucoidanivorans]TNJ41357.1 hypothetical protein FGF67_16115 [Tamlana fucoidanivorans]